MRIVFTGTHGTGKTTLLDALKPYFYSLGYQVETSVSRYIKKLGLTINEKGNNDTQNLIMAIMMQNAVINDCLISDRCVIDTLMYSRYMYENGTINEETLSKAERTVNKTIHLYDHIFWLRPEFPLVDDGSRSSNVQFQKDVDVEFQHFFEENPKKNVHLLKGTVEERLAEFYLIMNNDKKFQSEIGGF